MPAKQKLTELALHKLFETGRGSSFTVTYKNGITEHFGEEGSPQFAIRFNDDDILDLIAGDLLVSFGEAYVDGRVDLDGDLADLIFLAIRSGLMAVNGEPPGFTGATLLRAVGKLAFSHQREKANIAHHYDLGNDFFRLWLDSSLTYSCAYFHQPSDTLEAAQQQKIDHSLRKLRLQPRETLLDIGCGWGAMVMRAAEAYGVKATGITLSEEQYAGANAALATAGLNENAGIRLASYRTLAADGEQFDKIISIGMVEHVGKDHLAEFAADAEALLKPGGVALLHLITSVKEGPINHWVEQNIFPGGYIPTLAEMVAHLSGRDFRILDIENIGPHYRLTLDQWSDRFERALPAVREMFDERFIRMWRLYLRASSAAFRAGSLEVHQILVSRGQPTGDPMTREYIYNGH